MSERQLQNSLVSVTTISFIIFWDFSMFYQIFLSPQVKWGAIITHQRDIYDSPHELPNNSPLRGAMPPPRASPKYPMSHCSQDETPHPPPQSMPDHPGTSWQPAPKSSGTLEAHQKRCMAKSNPINPFITETPITRKLAPYDEDPRHERAKAASCRFWACNLRLY